LTKFHQFQKKKKKKAGAQSFSLIFLVAFKSSLVFLSFFLKQSCSPMMMVKGRKNKKPVLLHA